MKNVAGLSTCVLLVASTPAAAQLTEGTFSIIARDTVTGELGMAVQSKTPAPMMSPAASVNTGCGTIDEKSPESRSSRVTFVTILGELGMAVLTAMDAGQRAGRLAKSAAMVIAKPLAGAAGFGDRPLDADSRAPLTELPTANMFPMRQ